MPFIVKRLKVYCLFESLGSELTGGFDLCLPF